MKHFDQLTQQGKVRRLHRMARAVLAHYPIKAQKLTCISTRYSTIFRVDTLDGKRYMLRINVPNRRTPQQIRSEMQWLVAISQNTDVIVPQPMQTLAGDWLVTIETDGIPQARHAIITSWLDGRFINKNPKPHHAHALGEVMAKIHHYAEKFTPPIDFMTARHDNLWEWGVPTYLAEEDSLLSPVQKTVFKETVVQLETFLNSLYSNPDNLQFIHTDMHFSNAFYKAGQIQVFDFDDTMWGHPIQDIVVPLWWIDLLCKGDEYLKTAFREGYDSVRPFVYSDADITKAQLCRLLYGVNFMIHFRPQSRQQSIEDATERFAAWLEG